MRTLLVNLLAGPGTGKSTTAAAIFSHLKYQGITCEMALEFAKDLVWEQSRHLLANQIYVFGQQHHRINRLVGQVPIVISDSPLLHSVIYDTGENPHFLPMVVHEHSRHANFNVFLERVKKYDPKGRSQTLEEAQAIDERILALLAELERANGEAFASYPALPENAEAIAKKAVTLAVDLNTDPRGNPSDAESEVFLRQVQDAWFLNFLTSSDT